jgi:hypothetical protein
VLLAVAARVGRAPKRSARELVRPIAVLLGAMGACSLAAGLAALSVSPEGVEFLAGGIARKLPREHRVAFLADLWAHSASYLAGIVGGLFLVAWVARRRRRDGRALQSAA